MTRGLIDRLGLPLGSIGNAGGGGSRYRAAVMSDSPVAYWRLGEAAGPTIFDETTNDNDGAEAGAPTYGAAGALVGDTNTAVAFPALAGFVVPDDPTINLGDGPLSYEFWYNRTGVGSQGYMLAKGASNVRVYLDFDGTAYVESQGLGTACQASAPDDAGVWHHLVVTKSAADIWLVYIDAVDLTVAPVALSTANSITVLTFGASVNGWLGSLDEVALYNRVLTPARITAHFIAAQ